MEQRFWPKVNKSGPLPDPSTGITTPCWIWTAQISSSGYGVFSICRRPTAAHRVSYELVKGPIPDGLVTDHLCRVRSCVNPDHLQPTSMMINSQRQGLRTDNKSGHRGVYWSKPRRKWYVQVMANYKVYTRGHFTNLDDAIAAATKLRQELHG